MRLVKDMRAMGQSLAELRSTAAVEEERASFELAASACRFTRYARASVDDKLSFSATLMRAGEVQAATRLIAEVEGDVREEEMALVEAINEVQAARSLRRARITRLRLARLLITAMMGASLMGFSAMGIAVAGMLAERSAEPQPARVAAHLSSVRPDEPETRIVPGGKAVGHLRVGDRVIALNREQFNVLRDIRAGIADAVSLQAFLASLPHDVVDAVRRMIVFAATPLRQVITEAIEPLPEGSDAPGTGSASKTPKQSQSGPGGGSTGTGPPPSDDTTSGGTGGLDLNTKGLPL